MSLFKITETGACYKQKDDDIFHKRQTISSLYVTMN